MIKDVVRYLAAIPATLIITNPLVGEAYSMGLAAIVAGLGLLVIVARNARHIV